jgi:hypothetical protein
VIQKEIGHNGLKPNRWCPSFENSAQIKGTS